MENSLFTQVKLIKLCLFKTLDLYIGPIHIHSNLINHKHPLDTKENPFYLTYVYDQIPVQSRLIKVI